MKFSIQNLKIYIAFICFLVTGNAAFAQTIPKLPLPKREPKDTVVINKDSLLLAQLWEGRKKAKIKGYASVVTKEFVTQTGLFTVHRNKSKDLIYFEIPDSIFHRDIMVINRLAKISGDGKAGLLPGEEVSEKTIAFDMGPDSTIRIGYDLMVSEADSTSQIFKAVIKSSINPIAVTFPILAVGKGNHSYVIDVTKFLKEKSPLNNNDETRLKNVSADNAKDTYVDYIHTYPINIEIGISKNTERNKEPATFQINTSFIELPKVAAQRRFFDPRVGYFADYYNAFSDDQQKSEVKQFILHWRLEPKDADIAKWKNGELVEPKKPIIIYIDPATPKQWRPYLIKGINDWQAAFEQAGFKNAIWGKEWPENDTTMHMDDARYSMINYLPSPVSNAYGPNVHDPRSGEIIQTHIGWYHNVMELLHEWYMTQAGATDPKARKAIFDEDLMGELVRFVSSHEVGHTLGLRHNFGSSSKTPVDSLRNKHYLDIHGHTASIMDYARFNYVAQPEDNIPEYDLFPRIGEYDKWAIEWGYKYSGAANANDDKKVLDKWINDRVSKNPRLWFGDGETQRFDPRCQTEDLGDNAMKASTYGIKNLQRVLPNLPVWTLEGNGINNNLIKMYRSVQDQYFRYMGHVIKNIGGVRYTLKSAEQTGPEYVLVPKATQQEALDFFDKQLFTTPYWLMDKAVLAKVNVPDQANFVEDTQAKVLNTLMSIERINGLLADEKHFGAEAYEADKYIHKIHTQIWRELGGSGAIKIDSYRRNLQKSYFQNLLVIISEKDEANTETDASSIIKADLILLQGEIKRAVTRVEDPITLYHLKDLDSRIKQLLNPRT